MNENWQSGVVPEGGSELIRRVCIVSPRHVSYNPRVVKEADWLQAAGYEVTVVAVCNHPVQAELDGELMRFRSWRLLTFDYRREGRAWWNWLWTGVRQNAFRLMSWWLRSGFVIKRAAVREWAELARLAQSVPADLYIAHHAEALPVAWRAARWNGGKLGFDAEDFHTGMDGRPVPRELWSGDRPVEQVVADVLAWQKFQTHPVQERNLEWLEGRYLPRCATVTAASPLIAMAYEIKYGLKHAPVVIDNVFPWEAEQQLQEMRGMRRGAEIRLYWYSQVIGAGRGLEDAVAALGQLPARVELHLRGDVAEHYRRGLERLARSCGAGGRLHFHALAPPAELVREAARFDIGLALETGVETNRLLCLTNKIFSFLNAGIPVVATATPAQRHLASRLEGVCILCEPDDPRSLAAAIRRAVSNLEEKGADGLRREARRALGAIISWEGTQERLCGLLEAAAYQRRDKAGIVQKASEVMELGRPTGDDT